MIGQVFRTGSGAPPSGKDMDMIMDAGRNVGRMTRNRTGTTKDKKLDAGRMEECEVCGKKFKGVRLA